MNTNDNGFEFMKSYNQTTECLFNTPNDMKKVRDATLLPPKLIRPKKCPSPTGVPEELARALLDSFDKVADPVINKPKKLCKSCKVKEAKGEPYMVRSTSLDPSDVALYNVEMDQREDSMTDIIDLTIDEEMKVSPLRKRSALLALWEQQRAQVRDVRVKMETIVTDQEKFEIYKQLCGIDCDYVPAKPAKK